MEPLAYLHLQMRLEGKALVDHNLMRQVEVVSGEELPLILIAQLANQEMFVYYDEAMSLDLQRDLAARIPDIIFPNVSALLGIIKSYSIQFEMGHYKTYVFSPQAVIDVNVLCLSKHDPRVQTFGFDGFAEQVYAIERDSKLISACVSARENEGCGEAWVYTNPEYRHQGFAQRAVNAWARSLMNTGKVPFYSHKIDNVASAGLARKLGLEPVFEEIAISEI